MTLHIPTIMAAVRQGDRRVLNKLCAHLYPKVQQMVRSSMGRNNGRNPWHRSLFSTGDIVQEVFMNVLSSLEDFRGTTEAELLSYVSTLTRNRLVDAIRFYEASRRDRRRIDTESRQQDIQRVRDEQLNPESLAINHEELLRFYVALNRFTERDRNLLRERIENNREYGEIATMLGYASADSTRKAFHVAQAKLLARLRRDARSRDDQATQRPQEDSEST